VGGPRGGCQALPHYLERRPRSICVHNETPPALPKDNADLLARIQHARSALLQTSEQLAPAQMTVPGTGGWSIKDTLAQLEAWEQGMLRYHWRGESPHAAMHVDAAPLEPFDEDGLHALLYACDRDDSIHEVPIGEGRCGQQLQPAPINDWAQGLHQIIHQRVTA